MAFCMAHAFPNIKINGLWIIIFFTHKYLPRALEYGKTFHKERKERKKKIGKKRTSPALRFRDACIHSYNFIFILLVIIIRPGERGETWNGGEDGVNHVDRLYFITRFCFPPQFSKSFLQVCLFAIIRFFRVKPFIS